MLGGRIVSLILSKNPKGLVSPTLKLDMLPLILLGSSTAREGEARRRSLGVGCMIRPTDRVVALPFGCIGKEVTLRP